MGMRERQVHTQGEGFPGSGSSCAKASRHDHAQGAREMLEQPGGRV